MDIYQHANIHLKCMKYVFILGVAKWGGAIATQQYGRRMAAHAHVAVVVNLNPVLTQGVTPR